MAGDWMKIEKVTPDKPEVEAIADALDIDPDAAFGKLFRLWRWFDDHTEDGNARCVTAKQVDRRAGVQGFAQAMVDVGWLEFVDGVAALPNFNNHNGQTAKTRALTAKRVAKSKSKSNAENVTPVTQGALPREEKRRVNTPPPPAAVGESASPPTPGRSGPKAPTAVREAVTSVFGLPEVTKRDRTRLGKLARDFAARIPEDADPGDALSRALMAFRRKWPKATSTPEAIDKHWAELTAKNKPPRSAIDELAPEDLEALRRKVVKANPVLAGQPKASDAVRRAMAKMLSSKKSVGGHAA